MHIHHSRNRATGFSLVETIIAIGLFVLIMAAVVQLYFTYNTLFGVQQSSVDVTRSASFIMSEVNTASLQADAIVASHTFSANTYSSSSSTLVLELPSITSTGDIIANVHDYVAFYATSTSAYEVTDAGAGSARHSGTKHLSAVLNALTFTYNNSNITLATSTTVDATTSALVKGQTLKSHLQERTYLRNI